MSFNVENVVAKSLKYYNHDNSQGFSISGQQTFDKLMELLDRCKDQLFPETYLHRWEFNLIKQGYSLDVLEPLPDSKEKKYQDCIARILHLTHLGMKEPSRPFSSQLTTLQHELRELSKIDDERQSEFQQLAHYPTLVNHCLEEYLHYADEVTQSNSYNYNVDRVAKRIEQVPEIGPKFAHAIRTFGFLFFPDKWNEKILTNLKTVCFPKISSMWSFDPIKAFAEYISAQVRCSRIEDKDLNEDERQKIKDILKGLKDHYEKYYKSACLYTERDTTTHDAKDKKEALHLLTKESKERLETLSEDFIKKKNDSSEVKAALEKYKTLEEVLTRIQQKRQSHLTEANIKLGQIRQEDEQAIKKLKEEVEFAVNAKNEAAVAVKSASVPENTIVSSDMLPSLIEALQIFAENETLLILCYEDYLSFVEGKTSREPPEQKKWFGYW